MSASKKFKDFATRTYAAQAKAFLNAYWKEGSKDAENIWKWSLKFAELDIENGKEGKDLDEFAAHRFLEWLGETKTVKQMREEISKADLDFNKRIAFIEYLLWKYNKKVEEFVQRPQGDSKEIQALQDLLTQIQKDLESGQKKAEEAAKGAAEAAKKAQEAEQKESSAKKAEAELKEALDELKKQETAYKTKTELLTKKSEEGGVVAKNKAKAELAQHLAEDPMPLSKAKLTTEAATKKAEKARKEAEEARAKAQKAYDEADGLRKAADAAVDSLQAKFKDAEGKLEEVKEQGIGQGNVWWMERELAEAKKYAPTKAKLKTAF
eukprot:TRINITY_DN12952_c0_g1_i1.p1 TRINITY_DN12952_c0_g1~~TRINITY_DN12952_c0_g1_i1.p1  ORF type:complete len:323 (-),score=118.51 TRINITY_DN12952_c0_g1_i1:172-1140(-)